MPTASGQITNREVRLMEEMRSRNCTNTEIASAIGCSRATVLRYVGESPKVSQSPERQRLMHDRMRDRALRYTAFVERAAAFAPLLVTPSPF